MKSYLKFLSRNKVYTFISVAGLAVSLMFVILLGDYSSFPYSPYSFRAGALLLKIPSTTSRWSERYVFPKSFCDNNHSASNFIGNPCKNLRFVAL